MFADDSIESSFFLNSINQVDECDDICPPTGLPAGTVLSNCTLIFTGVTNGTWFAITPQVSELEDRFYLFAPTPVKFLGGRFHQQEQYHTDELRSSSVLDLCYGKSIMLTLPRHTSPDRLPGGSSWNAS